ncbi:hypothetical protein HD554DRAFT_2173583 [Boletus coccyginus]|nr:hypothetical protein HD554DRAFT_2173583 [Boletus coccyginus]
MGRAPKPLHLDTNVFAEVSQDSQYVICHASSKKHRRNLENATGGKAQQTQSGLGTHRGFQSTLFQTVQDELFEIYDETERNLSPLLQSNVTARNSRNSSVPLSQLWNKFQAEHTIFLDDYFDKMQQKIEEGESLFTSILPPLKEELGPEDDSEGELPVPDLEAIYADYGIDIDAVANGTIHHTKFKAVSGVSPGEPLYPWKSMPEFLTHLLFSSPHLRFSRPQQAAVLDWDKRAWSTWSAFDVTTASGSVFYLNAINKAIAMDFANPLTRFAMQKYPENGQGRMSQVHHGSKMLEDLPDGLAPPCVHVDCAIYFVNELLRQLTGQYFISKKFFQTRMSMEGGSMEPTVFVLGYKAYKTAEGFAINPERAIVPVSTFFDTFEDLQHQAASSVAFTNIMLNPLRMKSGGRMVYSVPLVVFMDNVSGNISKQWNKHHVVYMSNALLPWEVLEQEFSIRFISGSPHATLMELMHDIKESIQKATNNPIVAFDVKHQEEVVLILYELIITSNNLMQAEECSHGGLKCNYFCRTCKVSGTHAEKNTDKRYTDIFQVL